jgi:hypothetical protein
LREYWGVVICVRSSDKKEEKDFQQNLLTIGPGQDYCSGHNEGV